jgi:hypothetical protein
MSSRYRRRTRFFVFHAFLCLLGLAMAIPGFMWVSRALAGERAFNQASVCVDQERDGCLFETDAVVIRREVHGSSGPGDVSNCLVILEVPGRPEQVMYTESGKAYAACKDDVVAGESVKIRYWRDIIVSLEAPSYTIHQYPHGWVFNPSLLLQFGIMIAEWGLLGILLGLWREASPLLLDNADLVDIGGFGLALLGAGINIFVIFMNGLAELAPFPAFYWPLTISMAAAVAVAAVCRYVRDPYK